MPFPTPCVAPQAVPVRLFLAEEPGVRIWRGFGSTIFSFTEPELFERPGRPNAEAPLPRTVLDRLLELAYDECGLTRGRVFPFRYERSVYANEAYVSANGWTAEDIGRRGIDRVLDHVIAARKHGLSELVGTCGAWDIPKPLLAGNGRMLNPEAYSEYIARVVRVLSHWKHEYGIEVSAWSLFNEPNYPRNKPAVLDVAGHVELTRVLGRAFEDAGLATRILTADDWTIGHRAMEIARAVLDDPEARRYVCAVGYHGYDGYDFCAQNPRDFDAERRARAELAALCASHGVETWMTEISNFRPAESAWRNTVFRMSQIFDDLEFGRVNAWDFMLDFWCGGWRLNDRGGPQGLAEFYYELDGSIRRTQLTWTGTAIGHFARTVRPGWKVLSVEGMGHGLRAAAFQEPNSRRVAAVLLNTGEVPLELTLTAPNPWRWLSEARVFYSSPTDSWADAGLLAQKNELYQFLLKPCMVATLEGELCVGCV